MPTGYTEGIYNGEKVSAEEFILKCARNFGALAAMRDEPVDSEIPVFKPSSHHKDRVEKLKIMMNQLKKMNKSEKEVESKKEFSEAMTVYYERLHRATSTKERYEKVLLEVQKWVPPTEEHEQLKAFAVSQLEESIQSDCNTDYFKKPEKIIVEDWYSSQLEDIEKEIEYHERNHEEEVQRVSLRNEWVKRLVESF